ncbi:MAG: hypothetical protein JNK46_04500 [Methylobacteriaceae bacterium]|nr:hypothetical protein [Methylobacteriaceae bacterium]
MQDAAQGFPFGDVLIWLVVMSAIVGLVTVIVRRRAAGRGRPTGMRPGVTGQTGGGDSGPMVFLGGAGGGGDGGG